MVETDNVYRLQIFQKISIVFDNKSTFTMEDSAPIGVTMAIRFKINRRQEKRYRRYLYCRKTSGYVIGMLPVFPYAF